MEGPHNIDDHRSSTAPNLLRTIAATTATPGANPLHRGGDQFLALGPEHARLLADAGLSRGDVQQYLFENARVDATRVGAEKLREASLRGGYRLLPEAWGHRVAIARAPEDIRVLVAGGAGKHSVRMPTFGATWSQTVRLLRSPVTAARSHRSTRRPAGRTTWKGSDRPMGPWEDDAGGHAAAGDRPRPARRGPGVPARGGRRFPCSWRVSVEHT
ncbi:hypothetical protein [Streptomyces fragilis]|uniref:Uncharacterized protein n=1 Tax=Streptomyces fragilis TaxID=67301 RepID=A0ABV2YN13_9ACTN|nr:hypothetical protein [Streptomyces fragilis]